jgi:hypothetical protein
MFTEAAHAGKAKIVPIFGGEYYLWDFQFLNPEIYIKAIVWKTVHLSFMLKGK